MTAIAAESVITKSFTPVPVKVGPEIIPDSSRTATRAVSEAFVPVLSLPTRSASIASSCPFALITNLSFWETILPLILSHLSPPLVISPKKILPVEESILKITLSP